MALLMKMTCNEVTERGGGVMLPLCRAFRSSAVQAWPPPEKNLTTTGIWGHDLSPDSETHCPECLRLSDHLAEETGQQEVRSYHSSRGKGSEAITLRAVMSGGPDDPNAEWASATPSGELTATIDNPDAWDFCEVGVDYMVEIRRHVPSRGRRGSTDED